MYRNSNRGLIRTAPFVALTLCAGMAAADTVQFVSDPSTTTNSTWTGVSLSGSVSYQFDTNTSTGTAVFTMTNTTNASIGGFFTAFVFDIDDSFSNFSVPTLNPSDPDFSLIGTTTLNEFGPFGTTAFDAGAGIGGQFQGGGSPQDGIGIGQTGTFTFTVTGGDAGSLSAMSFLGDNGDGIALRFRGLTGGGSDKLLVTVVPLPPAVFGAGAMLGMGMLVRRIRSQRN